MNTEGSEAETHKAGILLQAARGYMGTLSRMGGS